MKISLFAMHRTVRIIREGPGSGFGFTLSGDSPVFVKSVDRGKCLFKVFVSLVCSYCIHIVPAWTIRLDGS